MSDLISIKGGRDGLRLRLDDSAEWASLTSALEQQLAQNSGFFAGARLILEIGDRAINDEQMAALLGIMQQHGVQLESLGATARESRNAARASGIVARPLPRYSEPAQPIVQHEHEGMLVTRTIRSGQVLRHHGHITLIGDANPGSEIIAGGSVVVWGRLLGLVHAGALGNPNVAVCALELRPTQLRIAEQITRSPDKAKNLGPEIARIEENQIVVEPWEGAKRG
ncbi:septum site-determining protein MinC [Oscillochloris trichoides DG-6]|uniref:Probable septum site-determining protein MinC n=1 Tax=Oscillochloris trichoides DG-6 TaxID=765420 RepID=E1IAA6_9CHLR|nr:septum site-determining protein MinC [Oscillochloris trichoides]EFO81860.1 septum site-determining protein MinC [Oscillochloris trichoides DG-6]